MKKAALLSLLVFQLLGFAKSSIDLFSINKQVETQSEKERLQMLPISYTDVLVKITGDKKIVDNADLQSIIGVRAPLALQKYSYYNKGTKKFIQMTFSDKEVKSLLAKYRLTFWPAERPEVLVWLTFTEANGNQWEVISDDNKPSFIDSIKRQADWRGLPVSFPVFDLQDLQSLSDTQDITEQTDVLKNLSKRYHADFVLAASISQDKTGEWRSHWQLSNDSEKMQWEFAGKNMIEILVHGVDAVSDVIVERYAQISEDKNSSKQVIFSVSEVGSVEDYLKVMHYLQTVKGVKRVEVVSVNDDKVNFEIFLSNNKDVFKKLVKKEAVLSFVKDEGLSNPGIVYCRLGDSDVNEATT